MFDIYVLYVKKYKFEKKVCLSNNTTQVAE